MAMVDEETRESTADSERRGTTKGNATLDRMLCSRQESQDECQFLRYVAALLRANIH
jgi:hypothetical protein